MPENPQKTSGAVTRALEGLRAGDPGAADEVFELLYAELRQIAELQMRGQAKGQTLQPTALVHEVYLRLMKGDAHFEDRKHFLRTAARAMRAVLVDFARRRHAAKRGGNRVRVTLNEALHGDREPTAEVLAVHEALDVLAQIDDRQSRVVELRYFGGLSVDETAEALDLSSTSVQRLWKMARAWLLRNA